MTQTPSPNRFHREHARHRRSAAEFAKDHPKADRIIDHISTIFSLVIYSLLGLGLATIVISTIERTI